MHGQVLIFRSTLHACVKITYNTYLHSYELAIFLHLFYACYTQLLAQPFGHLECIQPYESTLIISSFQPCEAICSICFRLLFVFSLSRIDNEQSHGLDASTFPQGQYHQFPLGKKGGCESGGVWQFAELTKTARDAE